MCFWNQAVLPLTLNRRLGLTPCWSHQAPGKFCRTTMGWAAFGLIALLPNYSWSGKNFA